MKALISKVDAQDQKLDQLTKLMMSLIDKQNAPPKGVYKNLGDTATEKDAFGSSGKTSRDEPYKSSYSKPLEKKDE